MKKMDQKQIDEWNDKYPPGTAVKLINDDNEIEHTHTRTPAWLIGHGIPLVSVEGRSGGYSLGRITPEVKP